MQGVVPQDAPVVSVAVWESKAFLAVPRVWHDPRADLGETVSRAKTQFLHDGPTLLEVPWPEPDPGNATHSLAAAASARLRLRKRPPPPRAFPRQDAQVGQLGPRAGWGGEFLRRCGSSNDEFPERRFRR